MPQQSILGPFAWLAAPSNVAPSAEDNAADSISAYAFLLGPGIDVEALTDVIDRARQIGVMPQRVLVTDNYLLAETYVRKLADWCEVEFIGLSVAVKFEAVLDVADGVAVWRHLESQLSIIAVDAESLDPREVDGIVRTARRKGHRIGLATTEAMRPDRDRSGRRRLACRASMALEVWRPELAHRPGARTWQCLLMLSAVASGCAALIAFPAELLTWVFLMASVPLMGLGFLRTCALFAPSPASSPVMGLRRDADSERTADHLLPTYTILIPLFREAPSLPQLVRALTQLDYPAAKLDIKLILESIDGKTIAAARQMRLPPWFQIVVVPDHPPRTKPKALNYALQLARGELLVIYDAEDIPQPEQLRLAAEQFLRAPGDIISLQAALSIDNGAETWLTRGIA